MKFLQLKFSQWRFSHLFLELHDKKKCTTACAMCVSIYHAHCVITRKLKLQKMYVTGLWGLLQNIISVKISTYRVKFGFNGWLFMLSGDMSCMNSLFSSSKKCLNWHVEMLYWSCIEANQLEVWPWHQRLELSYWVFTNPRFFGRYHLKRSWKLMAYKFAKETTILYINAVKTVHSHFSCTQQWEGMRLFILHKYKHASLWEKWLVAWWFAVCNRVNVQHLMP